MQSQNQAPPLEDRLRGLILSNDDTNTAHNAEMSSAPVGASPATPRASKKRPNQAQRRQMSSQWNIPVDVRQTSGPVHGQRQGSSYHGSPRSTHSAARPDPASAVHHGRGPAQHSRIPSGPAQPSFQAEQHYGHFQRNSSGPQAQDWRRPPQPADQRYSRGVNVMSPNAFGSRARPPQQNHQFHTSNNRQYFVKPEELANQSALLDWLCHQVNNGAEIEPSEIAEKENFRLHVQSICRTAIHKHEVEINNHPGFRPDTVELKCFGSLMSGFATKAADMDLGILSPMSAIPPEATDSPIPRIIERALLDAGYGARLLTRTRVPIIKLCERPSAKLYGALLEARGKWENGDVDEEHDADEDALDHHHDGAHIPMSEPQTVPEAKSQLPSSDEKAHSIPKSSDSSKTPKSRSWSLRQSSNQNLANYYGQAKKLLRQLNARDITHSNSHDFTPPEYQLLDEVSEAFIDGLHDKSLRQCIQGHPSYSNTPEAQVPNRRSLMGVFKMAEGESLVMLFENRQFGEADWKKDSQSKAIIQNWQNLHHTPGIGCNPLSFNKELQQAVENLRQIPSIQLMQLTQEQHESAASYFARTSKILKDLTGPDGPDSNVSSLAINNYVAGIHDVQVREQVQAFTASTEGVAIQQIALKHKLLQLADEYEKALERELYAIQDMPIVRAYVELLRVGHASGCENPSRESSGTVAIQLTQDSAAILERIRRLPDPSRLAPNQPKDKYNDKLEFPKSDIGVQCDINFSAHLALQNTLLLRCYSSTDPRVRPMVLFVKHWARVRGINTSYRGTLSSYGYVLMVLHYLVNVVEPFVCPNLQLLAPPDPNLPPDALEGITTCKGYNVRFWRDEVAIQALANENRLNQNEDSLGTLLRGFFEYFAQSNMMSTIQKRGFDWGRDVLSLRTQGGLLTKQEKQWTGAKTVRQPQSGMHQHTDDDHAQPGSAASVAGISAANLAGEPSPTKVTEFKEVRNRYLFAIEDPFEIEHNVARTVTHNGIVSIRDEFRRAWRIIKSAGRGGGGQSPVEDLLEDVNAKKEMEGNQAFAALLNEIHGLS